MNTNNATPAPLSETTVREAEEALKEARYRMMQGIEAEAQHRQAIYEATQDRELASRGSPCCAEVLSADTPPGVIAALVGELSKRLHGEDIIFTEELFRHMTGENTLPAWAHRVPDGRVFYLGKAWAVAEAAGIDLSPLVCGPFLEAL